MSTQPVAAAAVSYDAVVGRRVHQLMWDRGLTQTAFGQQVGIEQSNLAKKLRGKRGWSTDELVVVARELGVPIGTLFDEDPGLNMHTPD